jgi:hypothetical protein
VEVLIAIAITAIIGSGFVMIITQVFSISISDSNHMKALKQVENALHWINRDVQMAQDISQTIPGQFPVTLSWKEYIDDASPLNDIIVIYQINPATGELTRSESKNSGNTSVFLIASNIIVNGDLTTFEYDPVIRACNIRITAQVEGLKTASETREMNTMLRPRSSPTPTPSP